jgi:hypothetical protein
MPKLAVSNSADLRARETERVLHKAEQFTVVNLFGLPSCVCVVMKFVSVLD